MKPQGIHILIIDDDEINNFIAGKLIKKVQENTVVNTCLNGLDGINYVKSKIDSDDFPDIIFLDINMPVMNGWEFLDLYSDLTSKIKKEVTINMLSSSVYNEDIEKAKIYPSVNKFISKPLTIEKIQNLFDGLKITQ
ncbi:histidine kinase [Pedobacter psychrophilus]|uniref:Histidine kinase n=1 Tax=Pedobacter psychrophilus TaxID=1826909 RepID=A0A179DF12_9SPHI|nr:response regulator [Pedobacter psychrophilus]OAQ39089.1 histidine kinase [Pedobacter psychrophilus]